MVQTSFQVFGDTAYCEEYDMRLHLHQAESGERNYGDSIYHHDIIADYLFPG